MMNDQKHVDALNEELQRRLRAIYRDEPVPIKLNIKTPEGKAEFLRKYLDSVLERMLAKVPDMPEKWYGAELRMYAERMFGVYPNRINKRSLRYKSFVRDLGDKELL